MPDGEQLLIEVRPLRIEKGLTVEASTQFSKMGEGGFLAFWDMPPLLLEATHLCTHVCLCDLKLKFVVPPHNVSILLQGQKERSFESGHLRSMGALTLTIRG